MRIALQSLLICAGLACITGQGSASMPADVRTANTSAPPDNANFLDPKALAFYDPNHSSMPSVIEAYKSEGAIFSPPPPRLHVGAHELFNPVNIQEVISPLLMDFHTAIHSVSLPIAMIQDITAVQPDLRDTKAAEPVKNLDKQPELLAEAKEPSQLSIPLEMPALIAAAHPHLLDLHLAHREHFKPLLLLSAAPPDSPESVPVEPEAPVEPVPYGTQPHAEITPETTVVDPEPVLIRHKTFSEFYDPDSDEITAFDEDQEVNPTLLKRELELVKPQSEISKKEETTHQEIAPVVVQKTKTAEIFLPHTTPHVLYEKPIVLVSEPADLGPTEPRLISDSGINSKPEIISEVVTPHNRINHAAVVITDTRKEAVDTILLPPAPKKHISTLEVTDNKMLPIAEQEKTAQSIDSEHTTTHGVTAKQPQSDNMSVEVAGNTQNEALKNTIADEPNKEVTEDAKPKVSFDEAIAQLKDATPPEKLSHKPSPEDTPELTIGQIRVNNNDLIDIEYLNWKDGSLSYPLRTISKLFLASETVAENGLLIIEEASSHNRLSIDVDNQVVEISGTQWTVPGPPIVEKNDGLIIPSDVYVPKALIESFFSSSMTFRAENLITDLVTDKKIYINSDNIASEDTLNVDEIPDEEKEIPLSVTEQKNVLERLSFRATSSYNARYSQFRNIFGDPVSKKSATNTQNNFQLKFSGHLAGLPYSIKPEWYALGKQARLRGLEWNITKPYQNTDLSLGSFNLGLSPLVTPNVSMWGVVFASKNAKDFKINENLNPKYITTNSGKNGPPVFTQQLKNHGDSNLPDRDRRSLAEDINTPEAKNTTVLPKEERFFTDILHNKSKAYSLWFGKNAPQFAPLTLNSTASNNSLFVPQSNKLLLGGRYHYGLTDKLTFGVSTAADKIYGKPRTMNLLTTYFTNYTPDLTGLNSFRRDNNFFEGSSLGTSLKYQFARHFALRTEASASYYNQKPGFGNVFPTTGTGDAQNAALEYKNNRNNVTLNVFRFSPDYYTPSHVFNASTYDRRGIGLSTSGFLQRFKTSYLLGYERYQSNIGGRFSGGLVNANHYRLNLNKTFFKDLNTGGNLDWLDGENDDRQYKLQTSELFIRKALFKNWMLDSRFRQQVTQNIYVPINVTDSTSRIYNILNSKQNINTLFSSLYIPLKNENYVRIGQNLSNLITFVSLEGHFKIKNFSIDPLVQRSFASTQEENRLGARFYYQLKNGARLGFSYFYNQLKFSGTSFNSHQVYFDLADVLGFVGRNIVSMGRGSSINSNILAGKLFIDTNRNNSHDPLEPGIPNVSLLIDNDKKVSTNKNGLFVVPNLKPGEHSLQVQADDLPINLNVTSTRYNVNLLKDITTQTVDIGYIPEGSIIIGKIAIKTIDNKEIPVKQMVVYLLDDKDKLASYTTTDLEGNYRFSDIPPGTFHIDLSEQTKNSGKYKFISALPPITVPLDLKPTEPTTFEQETLKLLKLF